MKSCINPSKTSESRRIFSRQEVLELSLWLLSSSHCDKFELCAWAGALVQYTKYIKGQRADGA